ncbi:hypothetical protein GLOIN_2v1799994 [Rhizophagus irregularis DAOM 181602=DAOM 197198]|uniref:Uncharacterized protein n=1 Tax=Rhizophagus irregularis (strain DAOM 181602 / DAOM 197198 / MUCL 43194) TaxID=747089 RepID=A0A2P4PRC4_RHIID|nr:hypothetical protein GLOIN_2v1799994 [Rhizophagus irregularis DAOM 181602=DAOM 197198]POG67926.1 hypothetical protein GLOIN_2v1799994 [Rhizophagus irregularis DAOM 181602=DAOM 197198]|eukprot:XP_025174792.1 hypothetical protein GLOIN_2v1799994 [Rhizophagus irregularis DAOM 181602=DAOM 197198]
MATTGVTKNSIYGISGEWHRNGKEYCLSCVSSSNKFELTIVAYARPYSCPKKIKSEGRMKKSKCISFSPGIYEPKEVSIQHDWEIWLKEKKTILACRANHDTGLHIQQDFTSTIANFRQGFGSFGKWGFRQLLRRFRQATLEDNDVDKEHKAIYIRAVHLAHKNGVIIVNVNGSAVYDDLTKLSEDLEKVFKCMQISLFYQQQHHLQREASEKQLQILESYGIIVYSASY